MPHDDVPSGALAPYRVLDLTTHGWWLCGRLLADLGADVLQLEAPGGDPGRRLGPFAAGRHGDPDASLAWWFANRGKRTAQLDLDDPAGRARLLELVAGADVLIESWGPGGLAARGLDAATLHARNPALVITSLSPFGLDGPHAHHRGPDLVVVARSGFAWLSGEPDRAPNRVGEPQAYPLAAVEAAVHTLMALHHVRRSGTGQQVDVAAVAAVARCTMNACEFKVLEGRELVRSGSLVAYSPLRPRQLYRCADGEVVFMAAVGPLGGEGLERVRRWAAEAGFDVPAAFAGLDVHDPAVWAPLAAAGKVAETVAAIEATAEVAFAGRTKKELYREAVANRYLLAPVQTAADLLVDRQLDARGYWDRLEVPGVGAVTFPGPFARPSATPLRRDGAVPTRADGAAPDAARWARPRTAPPPGAEPADQDPMAGVKVLDLSWVGVGPLTARYLADYGATVLRLDHGVRADVLRVNPPFAGGFGINRSQFYADFNASKLGVGIDLANPAGRELVLRLAAWADVVVESFTPRTLRGLGLDYEQLRAVNPSLVMLSTCMQGQTGPNANYRGFGQLMGAITGFYSVIGWPDRPTMTYGAYTDFMAQRFCATALLAALDHQRRTGEGQHIDVSQLECSIHLLGPAVLDAAANAVVAGRHGNRDGTGRTVPHGIYRCRSVAEGIEGERWLALVCEDDAQWAALVAAMGAPAWAADPALATVEGRRAAQDRIDEELAAWCAPLDVDELVERLQPRVAAGSVTPPDGLHDDPQFRHLSYFVPLEHPVMGVQRYNGMQARLTRTPGRPRKAAPCVGEDTLFVLEELLGCDGDEVAAYLESGALQIELG
ncbi:MAG: CoA transferase [Acidimicrobiales bacterium]